MKIASKAGTSPPSLLHRRAERDIVASGPPELAKCFANRFTAFASPSKRVVVTGKNEIIS